MAVTVTFDLSNQHDRAEVQMLIEMMEHDQECSEACEHVHTETVSGAPLSIRTPPVDKLAVAAMGLPAGTAGEVARLFAPELPDTDGSEECDDTPVHTIQMPDSRIATSTDGINWTPTPVDLASIGFGQSGNVPAPAAMAPAVTPSIAAPTTAPIQTGAISPAPTAPDRDAAGLPWDARIHSSSKALNADGTWRVRRGLNPVIKNQIEAELRAPKVPAMPGNVPPAPPAPPAPVAAGSVVTPPAPPVTAPPVPVPPPAGCSFAAALMAMSSAKWDKSRMDARIAAHGHTIATVSQADPAVWAALIAEANAS